MYWMDLSGGDVAFYRDLLGWRPSGTGLFTVDGQVVAGYGAAGSPGWNLHTVVDDVAAACGSAGAWGGDVLRGPVASPLGALAVLADPTGAAFVVREPGRRADLLHRPMAFSWAELCSPDLERSRTFYSGLFGWDTVDVRMSMPAGETDYTVFVTGGAEVAGVLPAKAAFWPVEPPYWLSYVEVADAGAIAERAAGLGGAVVIEPFEVPRIGRIALLAGRSGEAFAVMQMPGHG